MQVLLLKTPVRLLFYQIDAGCSRPSGMTYGECGPSACPRCNVANLRPATLRNKQRDP